MTTITHSAGASTLASFSYTYDLANQLQPATEWDVTKTYSYDGFGQLTTVAFSTGGGESYAYDLNGNRTSANGVTYGPVGTGNRLTYDGTYTYHYDSNGNVTSKVGLTDTTTFTYDYRRPAVIKYRWPTDPGGWLHEGDLTWPKIIMARITHGYRITI